MGLTAAPVQQATEPSRAPNPAPSGLWGSVTRLIKPQHALIAYGLITAAIVICAPSVRRLVPVGAPGSDLPNWILGPLFPLAGLHVSDGWDTYSPGLIVLCAIGVIGLPLCWMLVANGTAQIKPKTLIWTVVGLYLLIAIAPPLLNRRLHLSLGWSARGPLQRKPLPARPRGEATGPNIWLDGSHLA